MKIKDASCFLILEMQVGFLSVYGKMKLLPVVVGSFDCRSLSKSTRRLEAGPDQVLDFCHTGARYNSHR